MFWHVKSLLSTLLHSKWGPLIYYMKNKYTLAVYTLTSRVTNYPIWFGSKDMGFSVLKLGQSVAGKLR